MSKENNNINTNNQLNNSNNYNNNINNNVNSNDVKNSDGEGGIINRIKTFGASIGITLAIDAYSIIFLITIIIIFIIILYFLSKPYALSYAKSTADLYIKFNEITSLNYRKMGTTKLGRCMIASAYNAPLLGSQMLGYTSEEILLPLLKSGIRYFEFNIFNSNLRTDAIPIVSNGYKNGEWKLTINTTTLEDCVKVLSANAFAISKNDKEGCPNPDDPLFIGLNLNTNNNIYTLDLVATILKKYFKHNLMDSKYAYQNENLASTPLNDFRGKVCVLSSRGFEGSKLEEFINGCWDGNNIRRMHYMQLENANLQSIREYNKKNLTIIIPHQEGDFFTVNYNPSLAIDCGCQFIAMNYQILDENIDAMITTFKNKSIVLKVKK